MADVNHNQEDEIVLFGETNFRSKKMRFGIKTDDRRRHMYIVGKTGMGKSELLKNLIAQDIQDGRGVAFVDPHGDVASALLDYVPKERIQDVIYFDPSDLQYPIAFNVMEHVRPEFRHLVADGLMGVFKKIWPDVWSPRMEYILNNTILALLEYPDATLLGVNRMLAVKAYREKILEKVTDPMVKSFWVDEFAKYADRLASEATASIQNKVGQFISSPIIRNIIGQTFSSLDMRYILDGNKIFIANVSKGKIGEDASRLLGALLITKIQLAAMSRANIPESERKDFYLYVDEFQNFATDSFAAILSEARKYGLSLTIAHQYIGQLVTDVSTRVKDAIFGNVGTIVCFRVGAEDAELFEKELAPEFEVNDIVNLGKREMYLKLMIDGVASHAFSARTIDTLPPLEHSYREEIIEESRKRYATPREEVESAIAQWAGPIETRSATGSGYDYGVRRQPSPAPRFPPRPPIAPPQRRQATPTRPIQRPPQGFQPVAKPPAEKPKMASLNDLLKETPVDFRGKKLQPQGKTEKPKPEIDLKSLNQVIKESLAKKDGE